MSEGRPRKAKEQMIEKYRPVKSMWHHGAQGRPRKAKEQMIEKYRPVKADVASWIVGQEEGPGRPRNN